jgi:DNA-binding GntR family transcriptional regulator
MAFPSLDPLSPGTRLVDRVKARLKTAIVEGRLGPGEPLSVPELARQLGLSRSPVREALIHLLAEGLVVESSRRGVAVAERGEEEVAELRELAAWLELSAVARLARGPADPVLLDRLARSCAAQRRAIQEGDEVRWASLNSEYHRLLVARCGSATLAAQFNLTLNQLRTAGADLRRTEVPARATAEHEALLDALRRGDRGAAEAVARAHLDIPG